jgi:hypothetical protein
MKQNVGGERASVSHEIWDPESRHSVTSHTDWNLNCTLHWRQKLKEVNSFSAQYGAAIYRAAEFCMLPNNSTTALLQLSSERSQTTAQLHSYSRVPHAPKQQHNCTHTAEFRTLPNNSTTALIQLSSACSQTTVQLHSRQLFVTLLAAEAVLVPDCTLSLNLLHLENLLPTWLAVAHLFRGWICSLHNTKCTQ